MVIHVFFVYIQSLTYQLPAPIDFLEQLYSCFIYSSVVYRGLVLQCLLFRFRLFDR